MRVVGEAVADAGVVHEWGDPDAAKVIRRADARQLKQLRCADGARAHHDLPVGESLMDPASTAVLDTDRPTVADDHPVHLRFRDLRSGGRCSAVVPSQTRGPAR